MCVRVLILYFEFPFECAKPLSKGSEMKPNNLFIASILVIG